MGFIAPKPRREPILLTIYFLPEAHLWLVQYESVVSAIWHIFYLAQQHSNGILD